MRSDALGTTTYSYDDAGRLIGEDRLEGPVAYEYDDEGILVEMTDPSGLTTFDHDDSGRIISVGSNAGIITYGYDELGRLESRTTPQSTTRYSYDTRGRLIGLDDSVAGEVAFTHTWGGVETVARPNGVITTNHYDLAGRLVRIDHEGPDGLIDSFDYELDRNGHPLEVQSEDGIESYVLDDLNRLVEARYPNGDIETFAYNKAGDRVGSSFNGAPTTYHYDDAGQLTQVTYSTDGTVTYTWDDNGNLIATSEGDTYTWTSRNMMASAQVGSVNQMYTYDASDIRVAVDGENWLWDRRGDQPSLISDGSMSYLGSLVASDGEDVVWPLPDRLGSARVRVDDTGTVSWTGSYLVSGLPHGESGEPAAMGFAGEYSDPTGLVHLRARQYNPAIGAFLSRDAMQPNGIGTQGFGLYTYATGNPASWRDPSGRSPMFEYFSAFRAGATWSGLFSIPLGLQRCGHPLSNPACWAGVVGPAAMVGGGGGLAAGFLIARYGAFSLFGAACVIGGGVSIGSGSVTRNLQGVSSSATDTATDAALGCISGLGGAGGSPPGSAAIQQLIGGLSLGVTG